MRKILSVLAVMGLTSTAASAVVACGDRGNSEVAKKDISTLFDGINLSVDGKAGMTVDDAYASFLNIDGVANILKTNELNQGDFILELTSLVKWNTAGELKITVRTRDTQYKGSILVAIKAFGQTTIDELVKVTTIEDAVGEVEGLPGGTPAMTADEAFQAFLKVNSDVEGLSDFVTYDETSYIAASVTTGDGVLWVNAKMNTAYWGSLKIIVKFVVNDTNLPEVIRALSFKGLFDFVVPVNILQSDLISVLNTGVKQIFLNKYGSFGTNIADINTNNITSTEIPTQEQLNTVGTIWKPSRTSDSQGNTWSNLSLYVDVVYKDDTQKQIIVSEVECSITVVGEDNQKELNESWLNLELTTPYTDRDAAFQAFLDSNKIITDLKDNVEVGTFVASEYGIPGTLIVTGKSNGKYSGSITVNIAARPQINLDVLNTNNLRGIPGMSVDDAYLMFWANNELDFPNFNVNDFVWDFTPPAYLKSGSLTITAKPNREFTGQVTVVITALTASDLSDGYIVDAVTQAAIPFGATMGLDQTIEDFVDGVIDGSEHPNDPHWWIKGQLVNYLEQYPVLKAIDFTKFSFVGFYLSDQTTVLTDQYIKANGKVGIEMPLQAKFNYGTIQGAFINFSMWFKPYKNGN